MKGVLDESKVESGTQVGAACAATCCGHDAQELAKRIEQGVDDAKAAVSAELEDANIAAERLLKRGRYAFEDGISETAHKVKRHPLSSLAIALATGAVLGFLVPRSPKK